MQRGNYLRSKKQTEKIIFRFIDSENSILLEPIEVVVSSLLSLRGATIRKSRLGTDLVRWYRNDVVVSFCQEILPFEIVIPFKS